MDKVEIIEKHFDKDWLEMTCSGGAILLAMGEEDTFVLDWIRSTGRDPMFVSIEALRLLQELSDYLRTPPSQTKTDD